MYRHCSRRVPDSKPDFTKDPQCMGPVARKIIRRSQTSFRWGGAEVCGGGVPAQCRPRHLTAITTLEIKNSKCFSCGKAGHYKCDCPVSKTAADSGARHSAYEITFAAGTLNEDKFIIDSGATSHMCSRKEWFSSLNQHQESLSAPPNLQFFNRRNRNYSEEKFSE
ncbi:hypothetical protein AVEN_25067-1 [Araneus ventricosus]|uniref:CCHC-type domain-containing protein n=1 Tax=Araneus ventricosus TaxID=182803 RepID=A0A4Y2QAF9_ARAVE|nr:hypothetical protein AVEN_25067-1 [Araneus ventricosus]